MINVNNMNVQGAWSHGNNILQDAKTKNKSKTQ